MVFSKSLPLAQLNIFTNSIKTLTESRLLQLQNSPALLLVIKKFVWVKQTISSFAVMK